MRKLYIIIALLSVCFCNAEAKEQKKEEPAAPPQTATAVCKTCINYIGQYNNITKKYESLKNQLNRYKTEAQKYVAPLKEISDGNFSLAELDIEKAEEDIARYEEGAEFVEFVEFIDPYPDEFDAPAAVKQLSKRVGLATEVQNAYAMLSDKYTAQENDEANIKLTKMSKNKSLTDEDKEICKNLAVELATDMELRGEFVKFLRKFCKPNNVIPNSKAAADACEDLKKNFVNAYFDGDNVPETYALVHEIIAEMTRTLTNYNGSLSDEAKFKDWIDNYVKQLSTK